MNSILDAAAPVRIGGGFEVDSASGRFFEGKIGFIEIWDEIKDAQYAADRYNGGAPTRVGGCVQQPPPPTTGPYAFVQADRGIVNYLTFTSEVGRVYSLEGAVNPPGTNFNATGWTATGDGNIMFSFDPDEPTGSSTGKTYRVRQL
jgi:hypothetical protein